MDIRDFEIMMLNLKNEEVKEKLKEVLYEMKKRKLTDQEGLDKATKIFYDFVDEIGKTKEIE